eukprot:406904-Alexandrium_andersonii.AAC.2
MVPLRLGLAVRARRLAAADLRVDLREALAQHLVVPLALRLLPNVLLRSTPSIARLSWLAQ